jgi:integrase
VKQHLAALRILFDWLVVGHMVEVNPAHSVRGPKHVVKKGKTPVLAADEARILLDSIDTSRVIGFRDRAPQALRADTFARVNAATAMRVEDYFVQGRRSWVRLYEKGGKQHEVPAHHNLDGYIEAYKALRNRILAEVLRSRQKFGQPGSAVSHCYSQCSGGRIRADFRPALSAKNRVWMSQIFGVCFGVLTRRWVDAISRYPLRRSERDWHDCLLAAILVDE